MHIVDIGVRTGRTADKHTEVTLRHRNQPLMIFQIIQTKLKSYTYFNVGPSYKVGSKYIMWVLFGCKRTKYFFLNLSKNWRSMVQPHRTPMAKTPASYVGGPSIRFAVPSDSTTIHYNYKTISHSYQFSIHDCLLP
jgi:hypothetical protein